MFSQLQKTIKERCHSSNSIHKIRKGSACDEAAGRKRDGKNIEEGVPLLQPQVKPPTRKKREIKKCKPIFTS